MDGIFSQNVHNTRNFHNLYISTNRTTAKLGDKTMVIEDFKSGT